MFIDVRKTMMKKMMMLAAMSMMTAVASAVTINWTIKVGEVDGNGIKKAHCALFMVTGKVATLGVSQAVLKDNASAWIDYEGGLGENPHNYLFYKENMPEGSNPVAIELSSGYNYGSFSDAATKGVTFTTKDFTSDVMTLVLFNPHHVNSSSGGWVTLEISGIQDVVDGTTIDLGELGWQATAVDNLTKVVPEPTALALLALGVAGLALKRKVK